MKNNNDTLRSRYIYCSEALSQELPWDYPVIDTFLTTGTMPDNFTEELAVRLMGHAMAYDTAVQLSHAHVPVTEELLNEFHNLLMGGPGGYREDLDDHLMPHFIDQVTASAYLPPIEYAALCHKRLMNLHPWKNNNGKVARLLLNYILMSHDLPIALISDKAAYESALNERLNIKELVTLIKASQAESYEK